MFSDRPEHADCEPAAKLLRRWRGEIRRAVARWTGEYQYTIDRVLSEMITRCEGLKLRTHRSHEESKTEAMIVLTVQTMNFLHGGRHRVAL